VDGNRDYGRGRRFIAGTLADVPMRWDRCRAVESRCIPGPEEWPLTSGIHGPEILEEPAARRPRIAT